MVKPRLENPWASRKTPGAKDRVPRQATGPPRQATGPPRHGAGVGVGMLRGDSTIWQKGN